MRAFHKITVLAACSILAACGSSADNSTDSVTRGAGSIDEIYQPVAPATLSPDEELGIADCYEIPTTGDAQSEPSPFGTTIQRVVKWIQLDIAPTPLGPLEPYDFVEWSVNESGEASRVSAPWLLAEVYALSEARNGRVVLGINENSDFLPTALIVLTGSANALRPWGTCSGVELRNNWAHRYATDASDERVSTPAELWLALIGEHPGPTVAEFGEWALAVEFPEQPDPAAFGDIDPRERFADIQDLPVDLLATAVQLDVAIGIPEPWRTAADVTICTWTPMGWNECSIFDIPEEYDDGRFHLDGLRQSGDPIEIWLLNDAADISGPAARLGTIDPSRFVDTPIVVDVDASLLPPEAISDPTVLLVAPPPVDVLTAPSLR